MNNDQAARSARRIATLIAIPLALLAGFVMFQLLKPRAAPVEQPRVQSSAPVTMDAPALDERQTLVCRALLSQLPDEIRDLKQRPVTAGPEQNAAYGDPAITVACGTPKPEVALTDKVFDINGVCWHADPTSTRWTTVDREVPITVAVPDSYQPAFPWVALLSNPVASTVLSTDGPVPTGCKDL
ncbi:DUF3515 domain-containing protein [Allorhizocola rhizosphaerae]|uniref:DUF3515 domain-containing protein n=1 Tax=Allorhizocola rhizosphaerae TaxID=1872709 RepID=UPI000E3CF03A|nr:DUF3515 domain-containing protein [Allorhizocola rhizosphaerae]